MKHPLWSAIYDLFQDVDDFLTKGELPAASAPTTTSRQSSHAIVAATVKKPRGPGIAAVAAFDASEDMLNARAAIRGRLDVLKASLAATLTERETYLVLFPVVVFCDEMVKNQFPELATKWPPLQKELFRIDNGGEVFYETLDDLLRKPETLPFVYEVYYLCVSYGFRGKYADNLAKINEYKTKLETKIPVPVIEETAEAAGPSVVAPPRTHLWYYAAAAGSVLIVYAAGYLAAGL